MGREDGVKSVGVMQFRSHRENKMAAPSDSAIVIYDLTEK